MRCLELRQDDTFAEKMHLLVPEVKYIYLLTFIMSIFGGLNFYRSFRVYMFLYLFADP